MQSTTNYNLNKPENTDEIKISDLNENFDKIDTELKNANNEIDGLNENKVSTTGDVSDTIVTEYTTTQTSFPTLSVGEKLKVVFGKINKFINDVKNWKTTVDENLETNTTAIETLNSDSYKLSGGTEIPSNADLKSSQYLIPGNYCCPSNITANTLLNCPFKSAFILKVEISSGIGSQYIRQTFTQYDNSNVVSRVYLGDTSTWKDGINTNDFPYKVIEKYISDTVVQPKQSTEIINDLSSYGTHCSAFLCNIYGGPTIFQLNNSDINQHSFSIINQADVQVTIGGTILYFVN